MSLVSSDNKDDSVSIAARCSKPLARSFTISLFRSRMIGRRLEMSAPSRDLQSCTKLSSRSKCSTTTNERERKRERESVCVCVCVCELAQKTSLMDLKNGTLRKDDRLLWSGLFGQHRDGGRRVIGIGLHTRVHIVAFGCTAERRLDLGQARDHGRIERRID